MTVIGQRRLLFLAEPLLVYPVVDTVLVHFPEAEPAL